MKLQLNDVIRVKEDLQFHYALPYDAIVGHTWKVTTVINDSSVLVQKCTANGAVTHSRTKRVRNPDMNYFEFTDYYDILKTDDPDKLACERGESTPVGVPMISDEKLKELLAKIESPATTPEPMSGGVWWWPYVDNPYPDSYPFPSPETDPEIFAINEEEEVEEEYTGGSVSYYTVYVTNPTTGGREPYYIEVNDLIEALDMTFAEGNVVKATCRKAAARKFGAAKKGYDNGLYDSEKVVFFGERMVVQSQEENDREF